MNISPELQAQLSDLFGRLHPLMVHFPIALLIVAVLAEFLRVRRDDRSPSGSVLLCLSIGAVGAALAAGSGWFLEAHEPLGSSVERTVFLHRWIGVSVAVVAVVSMVFAWIARWRGTKLVTTIYRLGLLLSAIGVSVGGHLGGTLMYGEGYLTDAFTTNGTSEEVALVEPIAENEPVAEIPVPPASEYVALVQPILEEHCYRCHGPKKKKAGLRLDQPEELFTGDPGDWIVVPGVPDESLLLQRVSLPPDHEDHMPSKGESLSEAEIEILRTWIAGGALRK